jgi:hypothetical protein
MLLHTSPNDTLDFIIVGCCRSGTGYMSALFTACGYDVGHERLGKHGISSWCWAVTDTTTPGSGLPRKPTAASRHLIQVVREPWAVVSSILSNIIPHRPFRRWLRQHLPIVGETILARSVELVVGWNELIETLKPGLVVKAEEAKVVIPTWLEERNFPTSQPIIYQRILTPAASPCGCRRPWRVCSRYIFSTDWMTTPSVTVIR